MVYSNLKGGSTAIGERRIRVLTLAVPLTTHMSEVYASADQVAISALLAKKGMKLFL